MRLQTENNKWLTKNWIQVVVTTQKNNCDNCCELIQWSRNTPENKRNEKLICDPIISYGKVLAKIPIKPECVQLELYIKILQTGAMLLNIYTTHIVTIYLHGHLARS
jgi:hypothetical protein